MDLSQEEFLKFLNCRVVLNDTLEKQTILDKHNKPMTILKQPGKIKSHKVKLEEVAINNKVVRIHLPRLNLTGINLKKISNIFDARSLKALKNAHKRGVSSYGRHIKRKRSPNSVGVCDVEEKLPVTKTRRKIIDVKSLIGTPTRIEQKNGVLSKHIQFSGSKELSRNMHFGSQINKPLPLMQSYYHSKQPMYYLSFRNTKLPNDGRLNYNFERLVLDVKNMNLPSSTWKIKVVIRKNKISAIIFTNKCSPERSVTFSTKTNYFTIIIDDKPALLLGSPSTVNCIEDIEVLLNIVHSIDQGNSMILYK